MMPKYRKLPVVIDAVLIDAPGEETHRMEQWVLDAIRTGTLHSFGVDGSVRINTLEGTMDGPVGHYLIKGVKGELYSCAPDIFKATYEEVE